MAQVINKRKIYLMTYYGYIAKARPFTKETFFLYLKNKQLRWAEFRV